MPSSPRSTRPKAAEKSSAKSAPVPAVPVVAGSNGLSEADRKLLDTLLSQERARAVRSNGDLEASLAESTDIGGRSGGDVVDVSSDITIREQSTMLVSRGANNLREIDDALQRLRRSPDSFGICDTCQGAIGIGRLEILPTARHCKTHAPRM